MTETIVQKALELWGMSRADVSLAAHRENTVFKVDFDKRNYALRLHRPGYRSLAELTSELEWMAYLNANGLKTPKPIASTDGSFCQMVDGVVVDVLSWLGGETLTGKLQLGSSDQLISTFSALGRTLAELHVISDGWAMPSGFTRPSWNMDGLIGDSPVWGRFWENPSLTNEQRHRLENARNSVLKYSSGVISQLDYGLIHADAIPDNVIINGTNNYLIDFDDGGFGFRLFDLATTLNKMPAGSQKTEYETEFLTGYQSARDIDLTHLPLFRALRSLTYIGWIMTRLDNPDAGQKLEKFMAAAEHHLVQFENGESERG